MMQKPQMLLKKTIQKTKVFFHKTLQNLKSFLFGGYKRLPKAPIVNNIFCGNNAKQNTLELDSTYGVFSGLWETPLDDVEVRKENGEPSSVNTEGNGECRESLTDAAQQIDEKITREERKREEKRTANCQEGITGEPTSQSLAKTLKALEMMNVSDVDHVLDIEEVLHYYSRLTCPVYLDMVNKFFMDMYNEYLLSQPTVSVNSSLIRNSPMRSLSPMKH